MEMKEYDDVISMCEKVLRRNRLDTDCLYLYARAMYLKNDRCRKSENKRSVFLIMDILGTIKEIKKVNSLLKESKKYENFLEEIAKIFDDYVMTEDFKNFIN